MKIIIVIGTIAFVVLGSIAVTALINLIDPNTGTMVRFIAGMPVGLIGFVLGVIAWDKFTDY